MRAVDAARRRIPGWAALLIAIVLLAAALFGGAALYGALPAPRAGAGELSLALDRLLQTVCILGLLYVAAPLLAGLMERRPRPQASVGAPVDAAGGALLGIVFFLVALGLVAVLGGVRPGAPPGPLPHRLEGAALGVGLILLQAGGEEVFFRGWLQPVLAARWGPWIGLVVTALLFAASHGAFRQLSPIAFANDALAGLAFGLLALRTGGLAAPLAAHWGWNWTEAYLVGATPNPGVDALGSIFDLDLSGSGWLAGGVDEMNGSVCATLALLGLIAAAAAWRKRRI